MTANFFLKKVSSFLLFLNITSLKLIVYNNNYYYPEKDKWDRSYANYKVLDYK